MSERQETHEYDPVEFVSDEEALAAGAAEAERWKPLLEKLNDQQEEASAREWRWSLFAAFCVIPVLGFLIVTNGNDRFAVLAAAAFSFFAGWAVRGAK